jgi:extracellular factor (EF) 3-hydroxypalmitic acid methyl ester biosynthesis protein
MRGTLLHLQSCRVAFDLCQPGLILRVSEVIEEFKVFVTDEESYSGRAVLTSIVDLGDRLVCEAKLEDPGVKLGQGSRAATSEQFRARYDKWFDGWQQHERLSPELKMSVLSLHGYLTDLKLLCEQFEVSILSHPSNERAGAEHALLASISGPVVGALDLMRERFLDAAGQTAPDLKGANHLFVARHLGPLFLCSPFGYRTYQKPLGYAGDYEMMNQIHRNTFEGASIYAKLVHYWLVNQPPARSVRVRVDFLKRRVLEEVTRVSVANRPARILNLGCGPAREIQHFIREHPVADKADITLLDFDNETLQHVTEGVQRAKTASGRLTTVTTRRISVAQLLRDAARPGSQTLGDPYDLIYCGGLFDYLSPRVCKQVVAMFYDHVAPGGAVVVANMYDRFRRFSEMLEYLLDWHLIYRNADDLKQFIPPGAPQGAPVSDDGINLFLDLRKPD